MAPTADRGVADPAAVVLDGSSIPHRQLGGKGSALARLIESGFPVPDTGVVTTDCYSATVDANPSVSHLIARIEADEPVSEAQIDAVFAAALVPVPVAETITEMAREVSGGNGVAVRSSATVEDLGGSSFAGQYRSVLDVDGSNGEEVLDAVRQVWASLWYPAPVAYRRAFGIVGAEVAMAVVVMRMISATTAGVVFTADPAGGAGARVEAVEGLGESLVSGERTPSAWVLPPEGVDSGASEPVPVPVQRAVALARRVESDFGTPQDVEWAAIGDEVYIVQARPITVLETHDGFDTAIDEHELTTAGIAEMVPGVQPPLRWELNRFILEEAFRAVLDSLGIIRGSNVEERPFIRRVRGRLALDFTQLREVAAHIPGAVEQLEVQYFGRSEDRDRPEIREGRIARARRDIHTHRTRRKVIDQADVLLAAVEALRDRRPELEALDEAELLAYSRRLLDVAARGLAGELGVAAAGAAAFEQLVRVLDRWLGEGEGEGEAAALAATAHSGAIRARVRDASAGVFAGPSWLELDSTPPTPARERDDGASEDLAELERRLKALPGWTRRRILTAQFVDVRIHMIRRNVRDVVEQLARREAAKAAVLELGGEVRRVYLELGGRFVERGVLTRATDVELLSSAEIAQAVTGSIDLYRDVLGRRRNWLSRYEGEGELPARFRGVPVREPTSLPEGDLLEGWAASPGRARGRARVVDSATGRLEPGEVLVATATDASWSPLFVRAEAIVVERGGPLSHAAILARELGLPAVLNVAGATAVLDGCTVSVDGDRGAVVVEARAVEP